MYSRFYTAERRGIDPKRLKIYSKYFYDVINGIKTFEIRKNDRNYQIDDILELKEYCADEKKYTGQTILVKVVYILENRDFLRDGYVALGIKEVKKLSHSITYNKNRLNPHGNSTKFPTNY